MPGCSVMHVIQKNVFTIHDFLSTIPMQFLDKAEVMFFMFQYDSISNGK